MSDRLTKLIDEQNTVWARMCAIRDAAEAEDRDLTAEERTNWDAAESRLTEVSGDIERLERMARLEAVDRSTVITTSGQGDGDAEVKPGGDQRARYSGVFDTYVRRGAGFLDFEQRQLLESGFAEVRAQGVATDVAGGYLVPDGFRNVMTETMKAFGGLLGLATIITTATGNDLPWPTNDDTGNIGAILAENTAITEQDVTLGQRKIGAYTYTSKLVRVSLQLLQDSAFDLESWLPRKLGERIGRAAAQHFCTGTGTNQPEGLVTNAVAGKVGATSAQAAITYDDLIDLEHSINSAYRTRARYLLSDSAMKMIRKLKDADGRPMWTPVPAPGFPPEINGFRYSIDDGMPVPAPGAKSIAFGDLELAYIIRQVLDVQLMRLAERYADLLQVGFFGFSRLDARPDDPAAVRVFQHGPAA